MSSQIDVSEEIQIQPTGIERRKQQITPQLGHDNLDTTS
jgi:hypothetical protein